MSFTVRSFDAPLTRDQVCVSLSSHFNRLSHADAAVEAAAAQTWKDLQRQSPQLFNASKFRLARWQQLNGPQERLRLDWGVTDYATYLGTCCSPLAPQLLKDGQQLKGDPFAYLSRKVGVAAVLETSDAHVALIKRSKRVGLYQDLYDTPGGHPEPSHINLTMEALQALGQPDQETKRREFEEKARDEFFRSIGNEVHEEVNLAPQHQADPLLLGVVLQSDACTPSFSFSVKTSCTAEELCELYRAGPSDKFESVKLELLEADSLLASESSPLDALKLTPSAQGTLGLWKKHTLHARQNRI
ncbi:Nudt22p [Phytophthora boehmeriae]|uniref:Nudt22p n=1 Tax=Phytophthora boehmeriae TaxID=109152 RepID=A0A8T1WPC6_9STRA|nr:Nudt22p [Phytophthora boehmeriae]